MSKGATDRNDARKVAVAKSVSVPDAHATSGDSLAAVIRLLSCPETYRARTSEVKRLETHISWLFLTDHFVYKLKKRVRFDFLDFSTTAKRKSACEQEVELNRRLARDVYLDVLPIVRTARGHLALDRAGEPVDWVVKMHRLPATKALDVLMHRGDLTDRDIESVAHRLTQFYGQLPPVSLAVADYLAQLERHVIANRDELLAASHHLDADQVTRIHARQLRFLKLVPNLPGNRVLDGRIVEGHGDLRPEHVYLTSPPVIIDCVEFSAEYRTLDVADELSFLAMECDVMNAYEVGRRILDHYVRVSGDAPPETLLSYYRAYRACVRAKVLALRAEQLKGGQRRRTLTTAQVYLNLADRYINDLGPPVVVLVRGLSGTGKSTIADLISLGTGSPLLQTDVIRRELFPPGTPETGYNRGRYSPEKRAEVYRELHIRANRLAAKGNSVVIDGTYLTRAARSEVVELAQRNGAALLSVRCNCAEDVASERIAARAQLHDNISDARPQFLRWQHENEETDPPGLDTVSVDTSSGTAEPERFIWDILGRICFPDQCED